MNSFFKFFSLFYIPHLVHTIVIMSPQERQNARVNQVPLGQGELRVELDRTARAARHLEIAGNLTQYGQRHLLHFLFDMVVKVEEGKINAHELKEPLDSSGFEGFQFEGRSKLIGNDPCILLNKGYVIAHMIFTLF